MKEKAEVPYQQSIEKYVDGSTEVRKEPDVTQIEKFLNVLSAARGEGRNIFLFGNGSSGAGASDMVCDFNKVVVAKNKNVSESSV